MHFCLSGGLGRLVGFSEACAPPQVGLNPGLGVPSPAPGGRAQTLSQQTPTLHSCGPTAAGVGGSISPAPVLWGLCSYGDTDKTHSRTLLCAMNRTSEGYGQRAEWGASVSRDTADRMSHTRSLLLPPDPSPGLAVQL